MRTPPLPSALNTLRRVIGSLASMKPKIERGSMWIHACEDATKMRPRSSAAIPRVMPESGNATLVHSPCCGSKPNANGHVKPAIHTRPAESIAMPYELGQPSCGAGAEIDLPAFAVFVSTDTI